MNEKKFQKLNVATSCFELLATNDAQAVEIAAKKLIEQAAEASSELLLLPEYFSSNLEGNADYTRWLRGDFFPMVSELAQKHAMCIVAGTHLLPVSEGDNKHYNTAVIALENGQLLYQPKIHLIPSEKEVFPVTVGASEAVVFRVKDFSTAVLICYDIEFPELCRKIVEFGNVDVLLVPSWTSTASGFWRVRHCCQARAIENQVYVLQAPLLSNGPQPGVGRSGIFSPCDFNLPENGVLAEGEWNCESLNFAQLSLHSLEFIRNRGQVATRKDAELRCWEKVNLSNTSE